MSGLTFRSLIHFEFIFVYGVRECSSFILLRVAVQFSGVILIAALLRYNSHTMQFTHLKYTIQQVLTHMQSEFTECNHFTTVNFTIFSSPTQPKETCMH